MTAMPPRTRRARGDRRGPARPAAGKPKTAGRPKSAPILNSIVWLASYPKSGNTWTRIFLANYLLNARQPVPINQVHRIGIGDSVPGAYRMVAGGHYDPADYLAHLRLRDRVLRGVVNNGAGMNFLKTHNARLRVQGTELIPAKYTRCAIYMLRDPLDVTVSYARHYGITTAETVQRLSRPDNGIAADASSVGHYLGGWSDHVRGWIESRDFPVHAMRYEDMKQAPHEAFAKMLSFLGIPVDDERLDRAVRFSSFDEMRRQESETPFTERSPHAERFFHSGETGQWQDSVAPEDAETLRRDHGELMAKFGYL
ncbi:MAG TPA: sulfotransferase domain-containing protein [Pararhizobium sp.]|nr:sulfotransferase domain-containing protein [Pararhizobium sp.]